MAHALQKNFRISPETAFATNEAARFDDDAYQVAAVVMPKVTLVQALIDNPEIRPTVASETPIILGNKNGSKVTWSEFMKSTGVAAGNATRAVASKRINWLLKHCFGGVNYQTGTTVGVGSTTTNIVVASSAGLVVGGGVMINGEARVVATIADATHFTPDVAFNTAPSNTDVVYAAATYSFDETAAVSTFAAELLGAQDGYMRALGCAADLKFADLGPNQHPKFVFEAIATDWITFATASAITASTTVTFDNTASPVTMGSAGGLFLTAASGTTRTLINCSALAIDPGIKIEAIPSISGTQGVQAFARTESAPTVSLTLNPYSNDWVTGFSARTAYKLILQIGSTAGNTVMIECSNLYLEVPEEGAVANQVAMNLKFRARGGRPSTASRVARAAIRVHLL